MNGNSDLVRRAQSANADTQFKFAREHDAGRTNQARGWYAGAAMPGHRLRSLAVNLMTNKPLAVDDSVKMLKLAAEHGGVEAVHLCSVLTDQDASLPNNWPMALDYLVKAGILGSATANRQLALLTQRIGRPADIVRPPP